METTNSNALLCGRCLVAPIPAASALKVGVCVGFIGLLAWSGAGIQGQTGQSPAAPAGAQSTATTGAGDRAATHRKLVFDERRTRFERNTPAKVARGEASVADAGILAP